MISSLNPCSLSLKLRWSRGRTPNLGRWNPCGVAEVFEEDRTYDWINMILEAWSEEVIYLKRWSNFRIFEIRHDFEMTFCRTFHPMGYLIKIHSPDVPNTVSVFTWVPAIPAIIQFLPAKCHQIVAIPVFLLYSFCIPFVFRLYSVCISVCIPFVFRVFRLYSVGIPFFSMSCPFVKIKNPLYFHVGQSKCVIFTFYCYLFVAINVVL